MRAARCSDNDRYFGPFTYAHEPRYRKLALSLKSRGDDDDEDGQCTLRIGLLSHTFIVVLPPIIRPYREKVFPDSWTSETINRLGRNWYWHIDAREYGFSYSDGYLSMHFGRQTHDSSTCKQKGWFAPWTQWRHVRRRFYGLDGEHVATLPDSGKSYLDDPGRWDRERAIEEATPTVAFDFADFDGERLVATTKIEEREWHFGTGRFKWLSLFRRPKISRSLDISFSGETGKRKGSWKGGTVGHSIDMLPGELHEAAFRRYCAEHDMTFIAATNPDMAGKGEE